MAIRGHVDGMLGAYVLGWAVAEPDVGNCLIRVETDGGLYGIGEAGSTGPMARARSNVAFNSVRPL